MNTENGPPCTNTDGSGLSDSECYDSAPCSGIDVPADQDRCINECKAQWDYVTYGNSGVKFPKAKPKYEPPTECPPFTFTNDGLIAAVNDYTADAVTKAATILKYGPIQCW